MFQRFNERARKVVVLAQDEARYFDHNYVGTEHLLLGLIREEEGIAAQALYSLSVDHEKVRKRVELFAGYGEERTSPQAPFTPRSKKVLELALTEALQFGHSYIGTEHILLGLLRESEGVAARVLSDLDVDTDEARREVVSRLGGKRRKHKGEDPSKRASRLFFENQSMKKEIRRLRAQIRKLQASEASSEAGQEAS